MLKEKKSLGGFEGGLEDELNRTVFPILVISLKQLLLLEFKICIFPMLPEAFCFFTWP